MDIYDDVATWSLFVNPTLNDIVAGVVVVLPACLASSLLLLNFKHNQ